MYVNSYPSAINYPFRRNAFLIFREIDALAYCVIIMSLQMSFIISVPVISLIEAESNFFLVGAFNHPTLKLMLEKLLISDDRTVLTK